MNKIYYLTYATHSERLFDLLKESATNNKINLHIIGFGNKWKGWKDRAQQILNHIKTLDNNQIICHIDGFDSLILGNDDELYNKFINMIGNKKIIFSVDKPFNKIAKYYKLKKFALCHDVFISAGLYIGYNYYIQYLLQKFINSNDKDDQHFYSSLCDTHDDIGYDNDSIIFYNYQHFQNKNKFEYENNRLIINNNKPLIISATGNTKINNILINFGYNYKETAKNNDIEYLIKNGKDDYKYFWKEIIFVILFIIILYNLIK
jgi:hypothetical protein